MRCDAYVRRARRAAAALALAGSLAVSLGACGGADATATPPGGSSSGGTVNVFAAASLQEAFSTLARQFEDARPGAEVVLNLGPSSGLAQQIGRGAPADVFASASTKVMDQVVAAGDAAAPRPFARNVMQIAVPRGNPGRVAGLADLARPGLKVALCQPQVPCGATAVDVFAKAGVAPRPVTLEADVKAVLAKVRLGEVDAGMVYVTDVRAAGDAVIGIAVPAEVNAATTYPIAVLTEAPNAAAAQEFVDYVLSPAGAAVIAASGFQRP